MTWALRIAQNLNVDLGGDKKERSAGPYPRVSLVGQIVRPGASLRSPTSLGVGPSCDPRPSQSPSQSRHHVARASRPTLGTSNVAQPDGPSKQRAGPSRVESLNDRARVARHEGHLHRANWRRSRVRNGSDLCINQACHRHSLARRDLACRHCIKHSADGLAASAKSSNVGVAGHTPGAKRARRESLARGARLHGATCVSPYLAQRRGCESR
jgi:hypothetical protein